MGSFSASIVHYRIFDEIQSPIIHYFSFLFGSIFYFIVPTFVSFDMYLHKTLKCTIYDNIAHFRCKVLTKMHFRNNFFFVLNFIIQKNPIVLKEFTHLLFLLLLQFTLLFFYFPCILLSSSFYLIQPKYCSKSFKSL